MSTAVTASAVLKKTPFHQFHLDHGGQMVEYAGFSMPIRYGSIIEEHKACRTSGGFFDVSHMGRIRFSGRHARRFLDKVCTRQIFGMTKGMCRYSLVCNERGGCRDDVLVYCFEEDEYLMVCNASNRAKLLVHFAEQTGDLVFRLEDETEKTAMAALQGPKVMDVVSQLSREIPALKRYRFTEKNLMVVKMVVSRTGYTGEDGVEVILGAMTAKLALSLFMKDKGEAGSVITPIGLGARDSLRLEAGMPLYGHEIDEDTDPLSAGLGFAVKLEKGADDDRVGRFIGQDALQKLAAAGPTQTLVGLQLDGRRSARQGMKVLQATAATGDREVGVVTSGCLSPTLDYPIAMAYVPVALGAVGTELMIDLGSSKAAAKVVKMPFYSALR
ncbi:MAG: glycine cleavage system aminomethyltransferase GcvT [Phycisphaerae bacterium]|nr:glycine cleavage system aminomethyltransferase GcvT [Phycisphaerae bacterium]